MTKAAQPSSTLARAALAPEKNCPVAAIARRVSKISARMNEVDDAGEERQLYELRRCFINDVEWLTPTSKEGALLTLLVLRERAEEALDTTDYYRDRLKAKISRLHSRILEWLSQSEGIVIDKLLLDAFPDTEIVTAFRDRWAA